MSLVSIKSDTEQYIKDNWVGAPIYWDNEEIEGDSAIHVSFVPVNRERYALGRTRDLTMMKIRSYGTTTTKVMALQDSMRELLECLEVGTSHYDVGVPSGSVIDLKTGVMEGTMLYSADTYG